MSDLISRQAAIDAINQREWLTQDAKEILAEVLEQLPSAEPERKTGRWIRHAIGHENTPWGFDCSACKKWFVIGEDTANQYNFCPNCGSYNGGRDNDGE